MIITEVLNLIADNLNLFMFYLGLALALSCFISVFFLRKIFSGMIASQLAFVLNTAVMLLLFTFDYVPFLFFVHFILVEIFITACGYNVYQVILANRGILLSSFARLPRIKMFYGVSIIVVLLIILNQFVVPKDGGSRIAYMTLWWFSYLRIVLTIVTPLGYFLAVNLLESKKYVYSLVLTTLLIIQNATGGSKAAFLIYFIAMGLLHRDLSGSRVRILRVNPVWALTVAFFLFYSTVFVLEKMGVDFRHMLLRLVMYAEATIMVYTAADPTEAGQGVTLFAALHRGFARFFNDPSATDIDTLFGFALSAIHYGKNTLTGPNSSVPAYFMCNFPGLYIFFGIAAVLVYTLAAKCFLKVQILSRIMPAVWLLPFVMWSITNFSQDYYTGMGDLTVMIIVSMALLTIRLVAFKFHSPYET